ncbi:TlpA family protein disulfide reductase [Pedobacter metabolipauper]|uniref:AhpC/TSA family protein n=1 Tax=Pedobacter metabolipauper TaxID=425513 RepID=A0A4R6T124_9SPHI|nr:TlpA disulfide reductase family protein [Pedobacter metabolipauper]TDQ11041.1 AhpC/TSA family protein [Pedobacter metabolipauper]
MKLSLLFLLLCCFTASNAQLLKLKKKQKFSYEVTRSDFMNSSQSSINHTYKTINLEVVNASGGEYLLKVTEPILIESTFGRIINSNLPLKEQDITFSSVMNKILSASVYYVRIDEHANIKRIVGVDSIKENILKTLNEFNVTTGIDQKILSEQGFKDRLRIIFPNMTVMDKDSASYAKGKTDGFGFINNASVKKEYETLDTNRFVQKISRDSKTGLLVNFLSNNEWVTKMISNGIVRYTRSVKKVNLQSSTIKKLGSGPLLLTETKKTLDLDNYYTPAYAAARKVEDLKNKFLQNNGKPGMDKEIQQELDVMDQSFSKSDYPYWAARVEIAGYIHDENYKNYYSMVPYEYFRRDFFVMQKMLYEFRDNNTEKLNTGLKIVFTKFAEDSKHGYPLNVHILDELVHNAMAEKIRTTSQADSIQAMLNLIKGTEQLQISQVNTLFAGLKAYAEAKLASNEKELTALANLPLNGVYDKHSRYRLLIYDEMTKKKVSDSIRSTYLDYTIEQLKNELSDQSLIEQLSINRKFLSDAYYRKSTSDQKSRASYLGLASDYMPSLSDRTNGSGELDREFAFLPEINYTQLLLAESGNGKMSEAQKLEKFVDLVILEPERYAALKESYHRAFPNGNFKDFFNKALKTKLPQTPPFELNEISGKKLSNKDQQRKFIFVDFWGTWCGACIQEIHKIDALYLTNKQPEKLMVTTIACLNKEEDVKAFMKQKKYSYPVLMSSGFTEQDFKISAYPTKLLLLPNGVYVDIPFNNDYQAVLDKYMNWDI